MQNFTSYETLRIIEALRSGVPSRLVSRAFTYGREEILDQIDDILSKIEETGYAEGFAFQADYGNGKSHLLNQIFESASKKNFVVSSVVLNKETPLCNLHVLYQKAAQSCYLPGHGLPGFDRELFRMNINDEKVVSFLNYAEQNFNPRFKHILEVCLNGNEENQQLFYGDLLGNLINISTLKSIYRLEFKQSIKVPSFRKTNPDEMIEYFRFLLMLFKAMGYSGWVLLFDEAELIGRHATKSRIKAYLNLYQLMNLGKVKNFELFCAFAFASTFETFINEKNDIELLPEKASENSSKVKKTIKRLMEIKNLEDLDQSDLIKIAEEVKKLHEFAFQWKSDLNLKEVISLGTVERRIRTMVRAVIQSLDLDYLGRPHGLEITSINESPMKEYDSFFCTSEDGL